MVFKCQEDSFLKEFTTKVVEIEKGLDDKLLVKFEDTILFPEGGGQPTDHGTVTVKGKSDEKLKVVNVVRKGPEAIHWIENADESKLSVGDEVVQVVDFVRRHDHMQQHSGQHLISALFEREYQYNTKAWKLGALGTLSFIEIEAKNLKEEEMRRIETLCNGYIAQALPVKVKLYETAEGAGDEATRAARGLPIDLSGPIRVIDIEGVDANMCCGTHVTNVAQLQVIKLMSFEMQKNKTLVHFLVGDRVLQKLGETFQRELQFNILLGGGSETHIDLLKKIQANLKLAQKAQKLLAREVATKIADELNADPTPKKFYSMHRSDGVDMDFINTFLRVAKSKTTFYFVTLADATDPKSGSLVINGEAEDVAALGDQICQLLSGKGNGKGNRFQARISIQLSKIKECEKLIESHFANK